MFYLTACHRFHSGSFNIMGVWRNIDENKNKLVNPNGFSWLLVSIRILSHDLCIFFNLNLQLKCWDISNVIVHFPNVHINFNVLSTNLKWIMIYRVSKIANKTKFWSRNTGNMRKILETAKIRIKCGNLESNNRSCFEVVMNQSFLPM